MRLPRTVNIRGRHYSIRRMSPDLQSDLEGDFSITHKRIRVKTNKNKDEAAHTLLHEVLHAIISEYDINLRSEELVVKTLENGLMQVLRDNPKLVEYLLGDR